MCSCVFVCTPINSYLNSLINIINSGVRKTSNIINNIYIIPLCLYRAAIDQWYRIWVF